eukprot:351952-Chlamydomonas_euryale.AAC.12
MPGCWIPVSVMARRFRAPPQTCRQAPCADLSLRHEWSRAQPRGEQSYCTQAPSARSLHAAGRLMSRSRLATAVTGAQFV